MRKVTKEKFYLYVNPRDICVTSRNLDHSRFETRDRVEVGRSYDTENYSQDGRLVRDYFLTENAFLELEKEIENASHNSQQNLSSN